MKRCAKVILLFLLVFFVSDAFSATYRFNEMYQASGSSYAINSTSYSSINPILGTNFQISAAGPSFTANNGNNVNLKLNYYNYLGVYTTVYGIATGPDKLNGKPYAFNFLVTTDSTFATLTGTAYILVVAGHESHYTTGATVTISNDHVDQSLNQVVEENPTVIDVSDLASFNTCFGYASAVQSFTVSGLHLINNLTVTCATGYEMSTSVAGTFSNSTISLTPFNGAVASTQIYVRLAASDAVGQYNTSSFIVTSQSANILYITPNGTVSPIPTAPTASATLQPTCTEPTGTIVVTDPLGAGYSYSIDGVNFANTTGTFTSVASGTYTVTVKNNSGCINNSTSSVTIDPQPPTPTAPTASATLQPTCTEPTGTIVVTDPLGAGYSYSIDGVNFINTTGTFTSVASGTYTVTVKNNSGCINNGTSSVIIDPQPPTPTAPTASATLQPTCTEPTGTIVVTDPLGAGYSYSIDGVNFANTTGTFTSVASGTYTVTVKNNSGCINNGTSSVTIDPQPPTPTAPTASATLQPTCTEPTGTIVVTDPLGAGYSYSIDGVNFANTTGTFTSVASGTYTVTVKNNSGCINNGTSSVTIDPQPPTPTAPTASATLQPTCTEPTGTIVVTDPLGAGYSYSIDGVNFTNTTGTFTSVASGTYTVTVKNNSGCINNSTSSVTIDPQPPTPTAPTASATLQPTCTEPTGTIVVTDPLGAGYSYSIDGVNFTNTTGTFTSVASGTYTVTVKNNSGCINNGTSGVTINPQPPTPNTPTANTIQPTYLEPQGSITVTSPTGTDFTYCLNSGTYQSSTYFNSLDPNTYNVTVKNYAGCISNGLSILLNNPPTDLKAGIFETTTNCSYYKLGDTTLKIAQLCYQVKSNKISNVTPGAFFYYTMVTAPSSSFSINVIQTKTLSNFQFFSIFQNNQIVLWNENCSKVATGVQITLGEGKIIITNAIPGNKYVLSVKYDSKSVVGSSISGVAPVCQYTFESKIGGVSIPGSKTSINLSANCTLPIKTATTGEPIMQNATITSEGQTLESNFNAKLLQNPNFSDFKLAIRSLSVEPVHILIADISGRIVFDLKTVSNQTLLVGKDLKSGLYMINVSQGANFKILKGIKM